MTEALAQAGVVAIFGILVGLLPLGVSVAYMIRPTERLLGLMRPLSLATIFAALNTGLSGLAATCRVIAATQAPSGYNIPRIAQGLWETVTPMFVACGFLAAAWLCVAVGMRRQP